VGDWVWDDLNDDGIQDSGDRGLEGVTVKFLNSQGKVVETTMTDPSSHYQFAGLPVGDYSLEFVAPSGYSLCHQARR